MPGGEARRVHMLSIRMRSRGAPCDNAARPRYPAGRPTRILHKLKAPLLVVHSQGDTVTSYHEAEQIAREAGGPVELVLYPEGNHVCDNVAYKARPMMADWMARQLGLSADWA